MTNVSNVNSWFPYLQHKPQAQMRLFCFPYAGGGASIFRLWSEQMPPEIEVCPVQLPGRENRLLDAPFSEMDLLIDTLAVALLPYLNVPYAFFGHSMGALISFELARYFRRIEDRFEPIHIFVSGHRAPHLPDSNLPTYHLSEKAFVEELRRLKGTPEEVLQNGELLQLVIPLLRADFALCQKYRYTYERPLKSSIMAFGGLQDNYVSPAMISAWQVQTSSTFKEYFLEGDHFFLQKKQFSLLQIIAQELFRMR
jgi:medium-chain acyl-[acyl-carrier-protein] hydrolase